jgi:hypothetical protein
MVLRQSRRPAADRATASLLPSALRNTMVTNRSSSNREPDDMDQYVHIRDSLGLYLCGELSPAEEAALETHLWCCAACQVEADGISAVVAMLMSMPAEVMAQFDTRPHGDAA